jgi:hypothetical protein
LSTDLQRDGVILFDCTSTDAENRYLADTGKTARAMLSGQSRRNYSSRRGKASEISWARAS